MSTKFEITLYFTSPINNLQQDPLTLILGLIWKRFLFYVDNSFKNKFNNITLVVQIFFFTKTTIWKVKQIFRRNKQNFAFLKQFCALIKINLIPTGKLILWKLIFGWKYILLFIDVRKEEKYVLVDLLKYHCLVLTPNFKNNRKRIRAANYFYV